MIRTRDYYYHYYILCNNIITRAIHFINYYYNGFLSFKLNNSLFNKIAIIFAHFPKLFILACYKKKYDQIKSSLLLFQVDIILIFWYGI